MGGLAHGLQFGITSIGGLALGHWSDQHGHTKAPLGTIGGLLLGSILAMFVLARSLK